MNDITDEICANVESILTGMKDCMLTKCSDCALLQFCNASYCVEWINDYCKTAVITKLTLA